MCEETCGGAGGLRRTWWAPTREMSQRKRNESSPPDAKCVVERGSHPTRNTASLCWVAVWGSGLGFGLCEGAGSLRPQAAANRHVRGAPNRHPPGPPPPPPSPCTNWTRFVLPPVLSGHAA